MQQLLATIKSHALEDDHINEVISKSSVYWHLDHILKVIIKVNERIQASDPKQYRPKFNFLKSMILLTGKIPRGKGRAPKHVLPPEEIHQSDLENQLTTAALLIDQIDTVNANAHFNHPMFGDMNVKKAMKFLKIHTEHHLKIVKDISR